MIKQVIVLRKDLHMRKGKFIAQACHGVGMSIYQQASVAPNHDASCDMVMVVPVSFDFIEWLQTGTKKVAVYVNSEEEMQDLIDKCKALSLPIQEVIDNGLTEFDGVKTLTCVVIGPAKSEIIDVVTGHLPLL